MNQKYQFDLIKRVLKNHQLKYVLRQYNDISLQLNKNKQEMLDNIDEEAAEYKFQSRQISFDDYCAIKKTYTKEFSEQITKNHFKISKYNLLNLYKVKSEQSQQRFDFMLLQKLSEHIGDMNLDELISCIDNLRVYDKNVIKFQFDLLSQRILELTNYMQNEQLIKILYLFGKFDSGTEEFWKELSKMFLFRISDLSKSDVLKVVKGYAGSNRGNELFWNKVFVNFNANCDNKIDQNDFDMTCILMRVQIQNSDFWLFLNHNYSKLLRIAQQNPQVFYTFFKYSVRNILQISQVNQIELFDGLIKFKSQFDQAKQMKILKLLAKNQILSQKIIDGFSESNIKLKLQDQHKLF